MHLLLNIIILFLKPEVSSNKGVTKLNSAASASQPYTE